MRRGMLTAASAPMTACRAAAMPVTRAVRAFARSDITAPWEMRPGCGSHARAGHIRCQFIEGGTR